MVWLNGFSYRRPITITNPVNTAGYQHRVDVTYDADMQAAFNDLRFVDSYGNQCPYWIEVKVDSTSANVWVRVPTANQTTLYMYYGNPVALSESNGDQTFDFFDDFSGAALDTSKWTNVANCTVSAGALTVGSGGTGNPYSTATFGTNYCIESKSYFQSYASGGTELAGFFNAALNTGCSWNNNKTNIRPSNFNGGVSTFGDDAAKCDAYYRQTIARNSTTSVIYIVDGSQQTITGNIPTGLLPVLFYGGSVNQVKCDWIAVRKYQATEPSCSIGSEESAPTQTTAFPLQRGGHDYES